MTLVIISHGITNVKGLSTKTSTHPTAKYTLIIIVNKKLFDTSHAPNQTGCLTTFKTETTLHKRKVVSLTSGDLSSQGPAPQVLLALKSLTAVFGMGTGVASSVLPLDI